MHKAAVCAASNQLGLETCTVYDRSGTILKDDIIAPNLSALAYGYSSYSSINWDYMHKNV